MEKLALRTPKEHSDLTSPFITAKVEGSFLGQICPKGSRLFLQPIQKDEIDAVGKEGYYYCQYRDGGFFGEFNSLSAMEAQATDKIIRLI